MAPMRLFLALGLVLAVEGCCGGMVKTPEARKSFIDSFNDKKNGCVLSSLSADHVKIEMECTGHDLAGLKPEIKGTCGAYQLVGFESMALKAKDGAASCDMAKDCSCN